MATAPRPPVNELQGSLREPFKGQRRRPQGAEPDSTAPTTPDTTVSVVMIPSFAPK